MINFWYAQPFKYFAIVNCKVKLTIFGSKQKAKQQPCHFGLQIWVGIDKNGINYMCTLLYPGYCLVY